MLLKAGGTTGGPLKLLRSLVNDKTQFHEFALINFHTRLKLSFG